MKKLNLIYAILPLLAIASCKKEANQGPASNKPAVPVIAAVTDSVAYTVDGKTYVATGGDNDLSFGYTDADRKLTFVTNNNIPGYSLVGPKDSMMYFQKSTILSESANIEVCFLKRFIKPNRLNGDPFPGLDDVLSMFTVGKHPFAEDWGWQNAQDGIAIALLANGRSYSSFDAYKGTETIVIPAGFQKNSSFEIVSFTTATDGGRNLVAKFSGVVADNATGEQKTLTNGYLRLHFAPPYGT